jgi:hypothetical protein
MTDRYHFVMRRTAVNGMTTSEMLEMYRNFAPILKVPDEDRNADLQHIVNTVDGKYWASIEKGEGGFVGDIKMISRVTRAFEELWSD